MRFTILISILIFAFGCTQEETRETTSKEDFTLDKEGEISFPIDSLTSMGVSRVSYYESEKGTFFSIYNGFNNIVNFYNYDSKTKIRNIEIPTEGPGGIGITDMLNGHFIWGDDTLIVHGASLDYIKMYNFKGKELGKISFGPNDKKVFYYSFYFSTPCRKSNSLIVPNVSDGLTIIDDKKVQSNLSQNLPMAWSVGINDRENKGLGHKSKSYDSGFHFPLNHICFIDINPQSGNLICSYPDDHYIYEVTKTGEIKTRYLVKSKYFSEVPLLNKDKDAGFALLDNSENNRLYREAKPRYDKLMVDKVQKVIYRLTFLPIDEAVFHSNPFMPRKASIIIMDYDYNKIGEYVLPDIYDPMEICFVTKDGLCFFRPDLYEKNEDRIVFDVLKVKALNKI